MEFRWSDGHRYSVEFPADAEDFADASASAYWRFVKLPPRDGHWSPGRPVHDGATHKNQLWVSEAELHVGIPSPAHQKTWQLVGKISAQIISASLVQVPKKGGTLGEMLAALEGGKKELVTEERFILPGKQLFEDNAVSWWERACKLVKTWSSD